MKSYLATLSPRTVARLDGISREEGVLIHTYVGDEIITEVENKFTDIESDITGLPIRVVSSFPDAVTEPVVKVLMLVEPEMLVHVEKKLQKAASRRAKRNAL